MAYCISAIYDAHKTSKTDVGTNVKIRLRFFYPFTEEHSSVGDNKISKNIAMRLARSRFSREDLPNT